jgi:hypothetical protein
LPTPRESELSTHYRHSLRQKADSHAAHRPSLFRPGYFCFNRTTLHVSNRPRSTRLTSIVIISTMHRLLVLRTITAVHGARTARSPLLLIPSATDESRQRIQRAAPRTRPSGVSRAPPAVTWSRFVNGPVRQVAGGLSRRAIYGVAAPMCGLPVRRRLRARCITGVD